MSRILRWGGVLLVVGAVAWAWAAHRGTPGEAPAPVPTHSPSHQRMLDALREISAHTPDTNKYTGSADARRLRTSLFASTADRTVEQRVALLSRLGIAELRLGNVERAIAAYEDALAATPADAPALRRADLEFDLALAYLQLGEQQNCSRNTHPDSCILPIRGGGVYRYREASVKAAAYFTEVVQLLQPDDPLRLKAAWLLNITHMTLGTWPLDVPEGVRIEPEAFASKIPFPRFPNVAIKLRLDKFDMSGGAAVEDFDGDGLLDILSSSYDPLAPLHLFRADGQGGFEHRTHEAGLEGITGGLNLLTTDYDNDGDVDVFILRGGWLALQGRHPNSLLRNDGKGRFEDVTFDAGLGKVNYPTQTAAFADYDLDGDLDLFVGNETSRGLSSPCQLFRNAGDGTFEDVAKQAGVLNRRFSKGCSWGDYDNDGDPDLYVSNLGQANRLYRNEGNGTFRNMAPALGVEGPELSFPLWFWDFDNDGALDIFVPNYLPTVNDLAAYYLGVETDYEKPRLYRGDGRGGFSDVAKERGLHYPFMPMGSNFGDLDGDGFLDFYLGTGEPSYEALIPNVMYVQRGERFVDVTEAGGFGHLQKGHGVAFADIDGDGDIDVFSQMGGAYPGDRFKNALYENPGFGNRWLKLELVGTRSNRMAIGARVRIVVEDADGSERAIARTIGTGGSFGANPLRPTIGLGAAQRIVAVEIRWPRAGASTQRMTGIELDSRVRVVEDQPAAVVLPVRKVRLRSGS